MNTSKMIRERWGFALQSVQRTPESQLVGRMETTCARALLCWAVLP